MILTQNKYIIYKIAPFFSNKFNYIKISIYIYNIFFRNMTFLENRSVVRVCKRYESDSENIESQQNRLIDGQDICIVRDEK